MRKKEVMLLRNSFLLLRPFAAGKGGKPGKSDPGNLKPGDFIFTLLFSAKTQTRMLTET